MIVKFKSIIMNSTNKPSELSEEDINSFNEYFKGRYCYLITCKKTNDFCLCVIPFDNNEGSINENTYKNYIHNYPYLDLDSNNNNGITFEYLLFYKGNPSGIDITTQAIWNPWSTFIDSELTEKSNSVNNLRGLNKMEPDSELTLDELKRFRTWLATTLYNRFNDVEDVPEKTIKMLNYYKNEMSDSATGLISDFSNTAYTIIPETQSTCSCNSLKLEVGNISNCDILSSYKRNIHDYMVEVFSNIDFWLNVDDETIDDGTFYALFKKYIDKIIENNFPLEPRDYSVSYGDCACLSGSISGQEVAINILKNLSKSISYIQNGTYLNHKNFVYDSFKTWSNSLYEYMRW